MVVTLSVAFLLTIPLQLCIREAIHEDFPGMRRSCSQRYSSKLFYRILTLSEYDCVIVKIALFSYNYSGELHYQLQQRNKQKDSITT